MRKEFANKLVKLRIDKKETQAEVAKSINIQQSTYAMYELGKRTPSDENKKKLATHFKTSVQEIFFD